MTDLAEAAPADVRPAVEQVAETFGTLMQTFAKARNRLLAAAAEDVEWSAHVILKTVRTGGPMRAGAIADAIQSDPSTISRQVAALVKDGLLERHADPLDGRAALLALTDRGQAVMADHDRIRVERYAEMLDGWTDADLGQFAVLLHRFTESYETANDHWMSERVVRNAARSGGHN